MISTHILDTTRGMPAGDVVISLEKQDASGIWQNIGSGKTNTDGRLVFECEKKAGHYRLNFGIENYFSSIVKTDHFFMDTSVVFNITNLERKYHVPLLINPYGYSTYRGS
jgi:5-hydroxyisourate hydrolase